ncbi:ferredoxin-type protein [Pragia fontium]|uniref:4Fe-4S binding protein n=1 Tax=Pragia fontium TaxID=82985 RepID=UPI000DFCF9C4|nr:4Fe-4S binding protein [Pragia fontium]SUB83641.1 ferredoxin-type protein [Pragia fontium]
MKDERFYKAYMEHRTVSRRGLFRGLLKGAQVTPEIQHEDNIKAEVIRPPGAVAEVLFRQACTGCGECVSACPESLIVLNEQRPEIDFLANYCTRCEACIQACPTGVLQKNTFNIHARPTLNHACQNSYMYCDSCAERCSKNAIRWQSGLSPQILTEACDGCAECAFVCPVKALEMVLS